MDLVKAELDGIYGASVLRDLKEIIWLYDVYDGVGQDWETPKGLDYKPTKKRTNFIKKLIKEQARFLFGRTPEFSLSCADKAVGNEINCYFLKVLEDSLFSEKLVKAARDCFVGKRVAVKVSASDAGVKISFVPSLGFVYNCSADDSDVLESIIFFHGLNDEDEKREQRIWKQKYWLEGGACFVCEGVYDGHGILVSGGEVLDTGLSFIPARVVVNDGLSGDLKGESDVLELVELQDVYNRLTSDDVDALKFNMFPQTVAVNASEGSLENLVISPAALIDLQTDVTETLGAAQLYKLESHFSYDTRLENVLNRIKGDMHEVLSIPNVTANELSGYFTSGKTIKALYWPLATRCEEKFAAWKPVLVWLFRAVISVASASGFLGVCLPDDLKVMVENVYPIMQDEFDEKKSDLEAVLAGAMSRRSYVKKWNRELDEEGLEKEMAWIREEVENGN